MLYSTTEHRVQHGVTNITYSSLRYQCKLQTEPIPTDPWMDPTYVHMWAKNGWRLHAWRVLWKAASKWRQKHVLNRQEKTPRQQSSTREDASNYTGDTRCKQGQWTNDWLHHICLELGVNRSPQAVCRTWLLRLQQLDLNNENASKYPGIRRWFAEISRCNDNKSQDICANESLKRIAESRYLRVFILRSAHLLMLNVLSIVLSIVYTCTC